MIRKIITIDQDKCNGCGLCAQACHEGAIGMENGKAVLLRDDYCDGLGDCLPVCPTGAITFEEREALEYNEAEVKARMAQKKAESERGSLGGHHEHGGHHAHGPHGGGCPGARAMALNHADAPARGAAASAPAQAAPTSMLRQWPVQIKLVPVTAPYLNGANLLIAADCAAYAHGDFHRTYMDGKITLIGCPKLDEGDYSQKLTAILSQNNIKSVTVVRMEVPCCGGIEQAVIKALQNCGKMIPWQVVTLTVDGKAM